MANFTRESITFDEAVDFTRGSGDASYYDSVGVLQFAAVDEPRFDHDPATGEALGLLIEESRTNLLLRSEDFTNAAWGKLNGAAIIPNQAIAPDGTLTADKIVGGGSPNAFISQSLSGNQNATHTMTVVAKAGEISWLRITNISATSNAAWFNLTDGVVGTVVVGGNSAFIEPIANGFYRCILVVNAFSFSSTVDFLIAGTDSDGATTGYIGQPNEGIFIWGAQLEEGSLPTSYIKTEATTVTRADDNCSRTLGAEFNASEGAFTVVAKAAIGTTIIQAGDLSIVSDNDDEKTYTLSYSEDPSATTLDLLPSGNGTIKSINYEPRA